MKYYWKDGFYIDEIHFDFDAETGEYTVPAGYAEITEELYHNLLDGQAAGKRIVTGADGLPELAEQLSPEPDPVADAEKLLRSMQVRAAALAIPAADDAAAFTLAPLCKTWAAGTHYDALEIVNHEERPYRVVQAVDSLEHQMPGAAGMLAIYRPIDPAPGTREEPKTFYLGMDVKEGLYYTSAGKLYLAKADLPACTYAPGTAGVWQWEEVADTE
ncbi:hypothetical protein [Victivallis vadensis]|uniref:hypothetical protein n=1 Tax=Victivallis vadensis TaxID=172901 RepID=UPI0026DD5DC1|nr:hypothetical protein [Victivallis vadensis]